MMLKNIITLTMNDLYMAFKNKTIFLILFIPFFVFISLKLVDSVSSEHKKIHLGLVKHDRYAPVIIQSIKAADRAFALSTVADRGEGERLIREKVIDGLMVAPPGAPDNVSLVVLKRESVQTLAIVESFSILQKAAEGKSPDWIAAVDPLQKSGIQKQTLPTWTLMLVLLVSFIIMPAQIAEEKEKKLLLALLQTPMREMEWLIAKLLLGMILILISVLFLHLLGRFDFGDGLSYGAFFLAGSFCFASYGILLGFLCRNQASARTLGVIFYLPHLLPSALSDFSQKLTKVAPLLPSYQFYEPVRKILLEDGRLADLSFDFFYLLVVGVVTFSLAYLLLKRRWLM